MSLSGEYTVAPRRGPRYRWRRGGREMDGKCRTEPPALPLSEVHQEGIVIWHVNVENFMIQSNSICCKNITYYHKITKTEKKSAKEDRFILQKMFVQEIFQ